MTCRGVGDNDSLDWRRPPTSLIACRVGRHKDVWNTVHFQPPLSEELNQQWIWPLKYKNCLASNIWRENIIKTLNIYNKPMQQVDSTYIPTLETYVVFSCSCKPPFHFPHSSLPKRTIKESCNNANISIPSLFWKPSVEIQKLFTKH
jgi:hypothetical protein